MCTEKMPDFDHTDLPNLKEKKKKVGYATRGSPCVGKVHDKKSQKSVNV